MWQIIHIIIVIIKIIIYWVFPLPSIDIFNISEVYQASDIFLILLR